MLRDLCHDLIKRIRSRHLNPAMAFFSAEAENYRRRPARHGGVLIATVTPLFTPGQKQKSSDESSSRRSRTETADSSDENSHEECEGVAPSNSLDVLWQRMFS